MVRWLLILVMACATSQAIASTWPHLPVPKGAKFVWVPNAAPANGFPQRIANLSSDSSPTAILGFYRATWSAPQLVNGRKIPGYLFRAVPPWEILSRLQDGYLIVIQVRGNNSGGTRGIVSIRDLRHQVSSSSAPFPMLDGSHVVNDTPSDTGGRKARTVTLANDSSIASNVGFYEQYLRQRGWRLVVSKSDERGASHVLILQKGAESANFFMQASGGTTVVVVNLMGTSGGL